MIGSHFYQLLNSRTTMEKMHLQAKLLFMPTTDITLGSRLETRKDKACLLQMTMQSSSRKERSQNNCGSQDSRWIDLTREATKEDKRVFGAVLLWSDKGPNPSSTTEDTRLINAWERFSDGNEGKADGFPTGSKVFYSCQGC